MAKIYCTFIHEHVDYKTPAITLSSAKRTRKTKSFSGRTPKPEASDVRLRQNAELLPID